MAYLNGKKILFSPTIIGDIDGAISHYNALWDAVQNRGKRKDWRYAFLSTEGVWTDEVLRPKYDIECEQGESMFYGLSKITKLKKGFNGEEDLQINTSKMTIANWIFFNMSSLLELPELDFSNIVRSQGAFYGCNSLTKLHLIVSEKTVFEDATFYGCDNLTDLKITGTIANDLYVHDCKALTGEVIYNQIVLNLKDYSGTETTRKLCLGQDLILKAKGYNPNAMKEAVGKGWTVV